MKIVQPSVELLWATPQAEKMIEIAGRTCYKSEPKVFADCYECKGSGKSITFIENINRPEISIQPYMVPIQTDCSSCSERSSREFIQKIIKSGHESVLEHSVVSLRVVCDRGVSHEFVRSRIGISYSQESTRYCNYSSDKFGTEITVIRPSNLNGYGIYPERDLEQLAREPSYLTWYHSMQVAEANYLQLISQGVKPQAARSVLPTCLKTEIAVTANIRAWRHFLKQRLSPKAHPDMQIVAKLIYQELIKHCPNCFFDIALIN